MGGATKPKGGPPPRDDTRHSKSQEEHDRRAQGELEERLAPRPFHRTNFSLLRTTCACTGRSGPRTSGTSDGTAPPTSTCSTSPRSVAQTQSAGDGEASAGHQTEALTPIRL